ncbi:MAG: Hsp20/alpha crystallin family protein [Desulfurococcales archaeon]|nr:Hsp20/alpha crystallin family protein [Desulfurococcales archaeon]
MEWRKRRSIFDIFDEIIRDIEDTMRSFEEEFERLLREGSTNIRGPYYYGVRITIGPDGVPRVEEFGNIRRTKLGKTIVSEEIEPLVDVIDADDEVWVIAELPGIPKEKIKVKATEDYVEIRAENGKKYYKKIELPVKVDPKSAVAKYKNGVLDIKLKKKEKKETKEETEIKVE